ncbi:hypothetical protein GGX14DRAFT_530178 [Mycena pura]|uniref:RING-type domain-containing protein n=1 Tax=Mycena pura TaxID=153505 RepID=A0AAD6YSF0_9AGAR|nr:hypothetical protein GGX14DRAFT_530178 [Mycena pura]
MYFCTHPSSFVMQPQSLPIAVLLSPSTNRTWEEQPSCCLIELISARSSIARSKYRAVPDDKKRAETRECPVCSEQIPIRLLAAHAELEAERVESIIRRVGETEVDFELLDALESLAETPTRPRLTALRGRKSIGSGSSPASADAAAACLAEASQKIQAIKRHRKQRHAKLKELVRGDEESGSSSRVRETWRRGARPGGEVVCPVCLVAVRGDEDVIEAHVDACLVDQVRRLEETRRMAREELRVPRNTERDLDADEGSGHVGNVRGTGFATRDPSAQDVDDEIDIDGDDEAVYGEAQFTEGDIVEAFPPAQRVRPGDEDMDVDVDMEDEQTLRELVAQGKVVKRENSTEQVEPSANAKDPTPIDDADKIDLAILAAKNRGDQESLLGLLQSKIKVLESRSTSLCRICIEAYIDPTVSTGCWHTCCKECWLRCLGSTKLCPICKRITAATDLRRVYL